ncbi:MAG: oxidoreductase [Propionibacteriaceae bacterium]|nr:oxidoreductase [Propionibacteriaceae bacterium]
MRMAVIGTGMVGRTLGEGLAKAGHDIVVGTRDPARTRARDEWGATSLSLASYGQIGVGADLFINATSGDASLEALQAVGDDALAGKVLIDVANALDRSSGFPPTLFVCNTDSLAEQLQRAFPRTKVVKAFNTMTAAVMVNPGAVGRGDTTVFVAGNDADARATVAAVATDLGWTDVMDLGDLTAARGLEMWVSLWLRLLMALGGPMFNIKVVR